MKILFITTTFARFSGDPFGGIGNCFYDLFSELSKLAEVDVIAPLNTDSVRYEKKRKLTIYREYPIKDYISLESMIKSTKVFDIPSMFLNIYRRARYLSMKNNYDIIHGFFIAPSGLIISMLPKKSVRIISALGSDVHSLSYKPLMPSLYKYIFSKIDGVIYNSSSMKDRLMDFQPKDIIFIPTPFNRSSFKLSKSLPSSPNFLFVGRLTKAKGVKVLLEAFQKVINILPNSALTIVGDGPDKNWMKDFIIKNNLVKSVEFAGNLDRSQIYKTIRKCYAFLLPSFGEGTPASVLEAMSVGRPIVATKVGGLKELVTNEVGLLAEPGDINQFAEMMIKVYKKKFIPGNINRKTAKFDTRLIAQEYFDYYRKRIRD